MQYCAIFSIKIEALSVNANAHAYVKYVISVDLSHSRMYLFYDCLQDNKEDY